ncbi:MAG: glycosyltransferase [Campylobacterota bacterium]|nr:glycosyltransferase [Campylobacterota bacterium]
MKKILYIVSTLKRSGPTNQLSYIIKYLDKSKFEPMVLTLSSEPKEDSMKSYFTDSLTVRVETLGLSRVKGLFSAKSYVKKFIKENSINLVHSQGIRADGIMSSIHIPRVATLRNYPYYDYPMKFGKLKGNIMAKGHLKAIKQKPDSNISCAKTIAEEFKQNGFKLNYIQNGVDTEKFFPLGDAQKKELREKLNINNEKKVFISVGSLIARKDMATLLEGFKKYNDENSLLLIAGDGVEKESLKEIANDNVQLLGNISNVVEYLQVSDCFVSASLAEGLPNTVLEAMACGLPTVLSDIPSHLELYEGEKGNFFEIKEVDKLAKLLNEVSNDFESQKDISLRLIKENFSAKAMSEKYQRVYEERLNESI